MSNYLVKGALLLFLGCFLQASNVSAITPPAGTNYTAVCTEPCIAVANSGLTPPATGNNILNAGRRTQRNRNFNGMGCQVYCNDTFTNLGWFGFFSQGDENRGCLDGCNAWRLDTGACDAGIFDFGRRPNLAGFCEMLHGDERYGCLAACNRMCNNTCGTSPLD